MGRKKFNMDPKKVSNFFSTCQELSACLWYDLWQIQLCFLKKNFFGNRSSQALFVYPVTLWAEA